MVLYIQEQVSILLKVQETLKDPLMCTLTSLSYSENQIFQFPWDLHHLWHLHVCHREDHQQDKGDPRGWRWGRGQWCDPDPRLERHGGQPHSDGTWWVLINLCTLPQSTSRMLSLIKQGPGLYYKQLCHWIIHPSGYWHQVLETGNRFSSHSPNLPYSKRVRSWWCLPICLYF